MPGAILTPRPMPERRMPIMLGGAVVALALPVFLLAGWDVRGWALGALLWAGSQIVGILLNKAGIGEPTLRGSGIAAFGMMARGIVLVLDPHRRRRREPVSRARRRAHLRGSPTASSWPRA